MAATVFTVRYIPGKDLDAVLFSPGQTAIAETVDLTETARPGLYQGTANEALSGVYEVELRVGAAKVADTSIELRDDVGPYQASNSAAANASLATAAELAKVIKSGEERTLARAGKASVAYTETRN